MRRSFLNITRRLIGIVAPLLPLMVLAIFAGVAGFLCSIFINIYGSYGLLYVAGRGIPFSLHFLFGSVLIFAMSRGILRYVEQICNHYIAFKLLALMRDKVFRALRLLAPAKLEGQGKGNLISLITTDIEMLEVFYAHTISPVCIAFFTCLIMTIYIAHFHILPAVLAVFGYIIVGVMIPVITAKKGRQTGQDYRNEFGELSTCYLDSLRGVHEIIQFGQGEKRLMEIARRTDTLGEKQRTLKQLEGRNVALTNTTIMVFSLATLFVSVRLYHAGAIEFPSVLLSTVAMMSSFGPVTVLSGLSNNLLHTFASANRILDILDELPVVEEVAQGEIVNFDGAECDTVTFAYDERKVLSDFSMVIPAGRIIGVSGKSGSGKSTLLRLLMRFRDVDSGIVRIANEDIRTVNTASLRRTESLVTQETCLFHDTIESNVKIAKLSATREQVMNACKKASIHTFIQSLPAGYDTDAGELGNTLSGGERQRIGIARAFLHDGSLMLLDEPTSNLDSLNEAVILKSLAEERSGKTIVLVSHRKSTLRIAHDVYSVENDK